MAKPAAQRVTAAPPPASPEVEQLVRDVIGRVADK